MTDCHNSYMLVLYSTRQIGLGELFKVIILHSRLKAQNIATFSNKHMVNKEDSKKMLLRKVQTRPS